MKAERKYFLFLFLIILSFSVYSQHCDSIEWLGRHTLKWKYFKGKPDRKSNANALSEPHIYSEYIITNHSAKFRFSCSFSTCHSWVKRNRTKNLLIHEQTHFDIAEYHKRLLVKEILTQKFTHNDIFTRVKSFGDQIDQLRRKADELHDLETNYSINEQKQKEWTKKIHKLIRKLRDFDKPEYVITLY